MKVARTPTYYSDDGKSFGTAEECRAYERKQRFASLSNLTGNQIVSLAASVDDWSSLSEKMKANALIVEELGAAIKKARLEAGESKYAGRVEKVAAAKPKRAAKAGRGGAQKAKSVKNANDSAPKRTTRKPKVNGNGAAGAVETPSTASELFAGE